MWFVHQVVVAFPLPGGFDVESDQRVGGLGHQALGELAHPQDGAAQILPYGRLGKPAARSSPALPSSPLPSVLSPQRARAGPPDPRGDGDVVLLAQVQSGPPPKADHVPQAVGAADGNTVDAHQPAANGIGRTH